MPGAALYFEMCHSTWNGPKLREGYDVFPFRRTTQEQYATAAHLAYARGADGVSLFNFAYYREHGARERGPFHEPPFEVIKRLRDPAWLAQQPQHWFLAPGWRAPGSKPTPVPRRIEPGQVAKFVLDLAPPKDGWKRDCRLRAQTAEPITVSHFTATLNGTALSSTDDITEPFASPYRSLLGTPETLRAWRVPASLLLAGVNRLEIRLASGSAVDIAFIDLAAE